MPSIDPREAGRRGGRIGGKSKSAAKLAACRRNGFQKVKDADQEQPQVVVEPVQQTETRRLPFVPTQAVNLGKGD